MSKATLRDLRDEYHARLCKEVVSLGGKAKSQASKEPYYNIADGDSRTSRAVAKRLIERLGHPISLDQCTPQAAGTKFASITCDYIESSFELLQHIRPGRFRFSASQSRDGITLYDQYEHLAILKRLSEEHRELKATLGGEYLITPDIVVMKEPLSDEELNQHGTLLEHEDSVCSHTPALLRNTSRPTLLASISCKWTMRSDRAQNVRTEALNLIRNRKGHVPRIVAVVFEPLPSRLVSIAIGTGDLDCTYHVALNELRTSLEELESVEQLEILDDLIAGKRIRDVADLPMDLAL